MKVHVYGRRHHHCHCDRHGNHHNPHHHHHHPHPHHHSHHHDNHHLYKAGASSGKCNKSRIIIFTRQSQDGAYHGAYRRISGAYPKSSVCVKLSKGRQEWQRQAVAAGRQQRQAAVAAAAAAAAEAAAAAVAAGSDDKRSGSKGWRTPPAQNNLSKVLVAHTRRRKRIALGAELAIKHRWRIPGADSAYHGRRTRIIVKEK